MDFNTPTDVASSRGTAPQSDALAPGIYFGHAALPGGRIYDMVMSIGWNPFFDNARKTIEPWLLHEFESGAFLYKRFSPIARFQHLIASPFN